MCTHATDTTPYGSSKKTATKDRDHLLNVHHGAQGYLTTEMGRCVGLSRLTEFRKVATDTPGPHRSTIAAIVDGVRP